MRKTSQDGGDNSSITSGVENEIKKPIVGIMKTKRNSIKRKVQNFSHDSDDAVIEPLLHKEKAETPNQSAKCLLPKTKTESSCEKGSDRDKLLSDERVEKPSLSTAPSVYGNTPVPNGTKETINHLTKSYENSSTIHNHMNANVFSSYDDANKIVTPKSQILVEIDGNKQTGYNPSPLIFTTAKIHTDIKTKSMEPVQVTPVPILSTIEGSVKVGMDKKLSGGCDKGNNMNNMLNTVYIKPYETQSKDVKNEKTITTVNNFSPCILSNDNSVKRNVGLDPNIVATSSSTLSNGPKKSVNTVDINNIPNNTGKSDFNTAPKNTLDSKKAPLNIGTKDTCKANASVVDVNKNIEANKIVTPHGTSTDSVVDDKKQLPIQKCSVELNSISDKNTNNTIIKKLVENSIIEPKKEKNPSETSLTKTKNDSNSLSKFTPVSSDTASLIKNETISTNLLTTTTNSIVKSPSTTITPISNTFIESTLVSVAASKTTVPIKNIVTNVTSTEKPTVSEEIITKASATSATTPLITSSSLVKSTATVKSLTTKPSALKSIPVIKSSIKTMPLQSASVNAVTMPVSIANTVSNKTVKPTETLSSNIKSNVKTLSAKIDSNKPINRPQSTDVSTSSSSVSSSIISNVKKQESTNQTLKSTTSGSKSSTSTIISKPGTVSTSQTSFSGKQISTKPTSIKSSNSSVKTLITSSDKPSNSGSVKTITSTKPQNKQIESKGTESNKKV